MNWKHAAKVAARWSVPPGIQELAIEPAHRWWASRSIPSDLREAFGRNSRYSGIHRGQRCFILATGPSINKQDLRPLRTEICIAVSLAFLHRDIRAIAPLYYVDAPNHHPQDFDYYRANFRYFPESLPDATTFFFGYKPYEYSIYNFLEENRHLWSEKIGFLNYCGAHELSESNFRDADVWDICRRLFAPRTVIYCAVQLAAYMGFGSIFLLGCDHDYLRDVERGRSEHFYSADRGVDDSADWPSTEDFFRIYHLRWKQYRLMRTYLESRSCRIYNATEGGMLDVFPRVSLEEALRSS